MIYFAQWRETKLDGEEENEKEDKEEDTSNSNERIRLGNSPRQTT